MPRGLIRIGCAGWALRKDDAADFPPPGTHLQRYAQRFNAVEINSSFYRPHRRTTYERWAAVVPDGFAFAVKAPKEITHTLRLEGAEAPLAAFLDEVTGLGDRLGPLLLQLPPSLTFSAPVARAFFAQLRKRFSGSVVCEPRHASWLAPRADAVLVKYRVGRVGADPAMAPAAADPAADRRVSYYRLHGAPRMYYSAYDAERLGEIAARLLRAARARREVWCIFDNTAADAALRNALAVQALIVGRA